LFNNDNVVVPSNSIETSYFSIQTNNVIEPMETNLVIESSIVKSYSKLIVPIHFPIKVVLEPMNQKKISFSTQFIQPFYEKTSIVKSHSKLILPIRPPIKVILEPKKKFCS